MVATFRDGARRRLPHQPDHPVQLQAAVRERTGSPTRAPSGTRTTTRGCRSRHLQALGAQDRRGAGEFQAASARREDHAGPAADGGGQAAARLGHGRKPGLRDAAATRAIRCGLSGQDSGRGTFFHRHAVLHDQNRERWDQGIHIPLQHLGAEAGRLRRHRFGAVGRGGAGLRIRLRDLRARTNW